MRTLSTNLNNYILEKLEYILGFVLLFFLSQTAAFISVGVLVFIDLCTGIWKSTKQKLSITSDRLKDTVTKLVVYNLLIITCMVTQYYLLPEIPFIKVGLGIVATVEVLSIFENMEYILKIKIISRFKSILKKSTTDPFTDELDKPTKEKS